MRTSAVQGSFPMRSLLLLAGFGLAFSMPAAGQSSPLDNVLKHVPDDAALVIVTPDTDKLVAGLAAFGKAIGVEELATIDKQELIEELQDSELFETMAEVLASIETFALALGPSHDEPLAILSARDPDALASLKTAIEALEAAAPESRDEFAKVVGNVVIWGADEQFVQAAATAGGKVAARMRKELGSLGTGNDVLLWIDVPAWKAQIDQAMTMAENIMQMGMAMAGPEAEAGMGLWKWIFDSCRTLVNETEVYGAAVRIGADGVFGADVARFKADGEIAGYLKKARKSQADLLRGLPDERAAIIFGCEWMLPEGTETLSEMMLKAILAGPMAETQPAAQERAAEIKRAIAAYGQLSGYNAAGMFAAGCKGLSAAGLYMTKNPKLLMQNIQALTELTTQMMGAFAPGVSVEVTRRQETVEAVLADVYTFVFETEDEQVGDMLSAMYGESLTLYFAPHPEGVLYAQGPAETAREQMSKLLAGGGKLSKNQDVAAALKTISPNPQMCLLVDPARVFGWAMGLAGATGGPIPDIHLPEKTPYVAFGFYLERDTVRAELWVPSPTIKAVAEAIEEAEEVGESGPM
jgi:hypothetical protein